MAGKGIVINFVADVRRFLKGTDDVGEALADVADSLDDAAREGEDATEKLERGFKDLTRVIDRETDDAADKMARNVKRGTDRVESQLDEVENEAKQNAAEMFSSFDGSFESIADAAQGTLGGLVGGLKGIPAIAAVAAGAAGIGLLSAEIIKQIDQAEELKQSLVDAYRAAAEEGRTFIDEAAINMTALDIYSDTERRTAAFADAAALGIDPERYIRALAGDVEAVNEAIARGEEKIGDFGTAWQTAIGFEGPRNVDSTVLGIVSTLQGIRRTHEENREGAEAYVDYMERASREQSEQVNRIRTVEEQRWDALGQRYTEAAEREPITIQTELAEPDIDRIRRNTQGSFERNPLVVRARLVTREGKELTG